MITLVLASCSTRRRHGGGELGECANPVILSEEADIEPNGTIRYSGRTAADTESGNCGGSGEEAVLYWIPTETDMYTISTEGSSFDTVVHLRTDCETSGTEVACETDGGDDGSARVTVEVFGTRPFFIFVDSDSGGGSFQVTITRGGPPMDGGVPMMDAGLPPPPSSCTDPIDLNASGTSQPDGSLRYMGNNAGGLWASEGSCGGRGQDSVLVYTPDRTGTLTASTDQPGTTFDTVVYVRGECGSPPTELGCDDDSGAGTTSTARAPVMAGVPVYIFVDGYGARSEGAYDLNVRVDEEIGVDAGPVDAGFDAGPMDAGPMDAGFDAAFDAGPPPDSGMCPVLTADCDRNPANGCETRLDTLANCRGCGIRCSRANSSATCGGAVCRIGMCNVGFADCDRVDSNGCELDVRSDVANCGGCGRPCGTRPNSTSMCSSSTCSFSCTGTFSDCNMLAFDGCEIDLQTDINHCGMCASACPARPNATRGCMAGTCGYSCTGAFADCNGTAPDGCETNTTMDLANCGGCGMACPTPANATRSCTSGTCGFACIPSFGDCNGMASDGCEVDTRTDVANCGGCGAACVMRPNTNRTCTGGSCNYTCLPGFEDCNGLASDGCEANLGSDPSNCSACGNRCPGMQMCCSGTCRRNCP